MTKTCFFFPEVEALIVCINHWAKTVDFIPLVSTTLLRPNVTHEYTVWWKATKRKYIVTKLQQVVFRFQSYYFHYKEVALQPYVR